MANMMANCILVVILVCVCDVVTVNGRFGLRQPFKLPIRALCIPQTAQLFEDHEGRHFCAYNHTNGFRAVGVGYNMDDDIDSRETEFAGVFADYNKVYIGDACLNNLQITTLLALDARRSLNAAAIHIPPFDDLCCEIEAVFADVAHSLGGTRFPAKEFKRVIEKTTLKEWHNAGKELKMTTWCDDNGRRCHDNVQYVEDGCNYITEVTR